MKRLLFAGVLGCASLLSAQTDNTLYVKNFPGSDVATKMTNAMLACTPSTVVPCQIVIDPSMAGYAPSILPQICSHCVLFDYRTRPVTITPSQCSLPAVVCVAPGESVSDAVGRLPASGGTVILPFGITPSGTEVVPISTSNVNVTGAAMPILNAARTGFVAGSGSIVQGSLVFVGASNINVSNLGVDVGDTYNHCIGEDGLVIAPVDDNIASPMLYNVSTVNISTVACHHTFSPSSQQHSIRVEHVTGLYQSNIYTANGFYGDVIKAINVDATQINGQGAFSCGFILKSDDTQGITLNAHIRGVTLNGGGGICLSTYGGVLKDVTIEDVSVTAIPAGIASTIALWGQNVTDPGTTAPGSMDGIKVSNFTIDGTFSDAVSFMPGSTNISLNDGTIRNITGNGIIFASSGPSFNTANMMRLKTVSGNGITAFGNTDLATDFACIGVAGFCVQSSGATAVLTTQNVTANGGAVFSVVSGGTMGTDVFPGAIQAGGVYTSTVVGPTGGVLTLRAAASPSYLLSVQNTSGSVNALLIDTSYNMLGATGAILLPGTATIYRGSSAGGPFLVTGILGTSPFGVTSDNTYTSQNLPKFGPTGSLTDSGIVAANLPTKSGTPTVNAGVCWKTASMLGTCTAGTWPNCTTCN